LIYHPDKQKDPENKRNAELLFSKIKKAYDVLIDPHKRAIYDSVGIKGLQENHLQLVVRSKSPQEIREEYERLFREKEQRRLESLTNSQVF
jgi:DnaJ family protein C protein 11